ncbi:MAG: ABC transporter substrate-binding protein, partial [Candidatus Fimimonas sp.]
MKKYFVIFLVLVLSLTLLCACTPTDNGKIKIRVGFWPDPSLKADTAMYEEWKANFEADYPQYEIVADPYTYSPETVGAKGNQGKLPTIFQTYFTEPDMLIREEYIRPITSQLAALGWTEKMDQSMLKTLSRNGEVYGVPRDGYGMGLFINLAMMYDIGAIEKDDDGKYILYAEDGSPLYPTTFEQVTQLSREVQDAYNGTKYGILILSANKQGGWQLVNMAWNFGAGNLQIQGEDGKWKSNLMDQGMVDALQWIQNLRKEDLCYPTAAANYNDWPQKIGSGDVLMAFVGCDALSMPITNYNFNKDDF